MPEYVSVCGIRRKDRAAKAIRHLRACGILAFYGKDDRSVNAFVTKQGRELTEKWLREALRNAGEPVAL